MANQACTVKPYPEALQQSLPCALRWCAVWRLTRFVQRMLRSPQVIRGRTSSCAASCAANCLSRKTARYDKRTRAECSTADRLIYENFPTRAHFLWWHNMISTIIHMLENSGNRWSPFGYPPSTLLVRTSIRSRRYASENCEVDIFWSKSTYTTFNSFLQACQTASNYQNTLDRLSLKLQIWK